jgi:hypothetical protein
MWEFISGIPPFNHEVHDHNLILSICEGMRPEFIKNTPKCYMDLMKKCWDSDPSNRPTIIILENIISQWIKCINKYYKIHKNSDYFYKVLEDIDDQQLENDMLEFVNANKALKVQEQANTSTIQPYPQVYYTSQKLITGILVQEKDECLECII